MKPFRTVCAMLALAPLAVAAATRSVTLSVPTMDCPVCPITIKQALGKVAGVSAVQVEFEARRATVIFDDGRTNVEALTRATRDAGYPSTAIGAPK